ncbi:hypothetical protein DIJ62_35990, partial [Burkholderia pseudomallei]
PERWPPEGLPKLALASFNTAVLVSSSVFVWLADRLVARRPPPAASGALAVAIAPGAASGIFLLC